MLGRIRGLHEDSRQTIGAPRMQEDLANEGETASLDRVARPMAQHGLQGWPQRKRRGVRGWPSQPASDVANQLERGFAAPEPDTK